MPAGISSTRTAWGGQQKHVSGNSESSHHALEPLSPQAMRRPIPQLRFGPYEKRHVRVDVQADPAAAATSPETTVLSAESDDAQALVVPAAAPPFVNGEIPRDFFKKFGQAIGAEREALSALPRASPTSSRSGAGAQPLHDTRQTLASSVLLRDTRQTRASSVLLRDTRQNRFNRP